MSPIYPCESSSRPRRERIIARAGHLDHLQTVKNGQLREGTAGEDPQMCLALVGVAASLPWIERVADVGLVRDMARHWLVPEHEAADVVPTGEVVGGDDHHAARCGHPG